MHPLSSSVEQIIKQAAQEIVLPYFRNLSDDKIEEKEPGEIVTIADRLSEEFLHEQLATILPEAELVGEEAVAANAATLDHLAHDQCWIIDPIDGTSNYAAGHAPFGIIIALSERNRTIAGWLYDPLSDRMCHAHLAGGAFINGIRTHAPPRPEGLPVAALATGFMTDDQREKILARAADRYQIVNIPRCAAEQYPRLALGENHVSVFERTLPWDHAAGILFLNEAGGKAVRWDGSEYRPADRKRGLLGASSPELWDEAAELMGDIFAD